MGRNSYGVVRPLLRRVLSLCTSVVSIEDKVKAQSHDEG